MKSLSGRFESPLPPDFSIVTEHPKSEFHPLNAFQEAAVKEAIVEPFTLIQGPPGIYFSFLFLLTL